MTPQSQQILREVLDLPPVDRAELVEHIMASFEFPARQDIDAAWAQEAEDRIEAYDRGEIGASPASEVFKGIDRQGALTEIATTSGVRHVSGVSRSVRHMGANMSTCREV